MTVDYSKLAFASTLRYMRKYDEYTVTSGGGTITHSLGYVPYFLVWAFQPGDGYLVSVRTGNVNFPNGDNAFYIVSPTTTTITLTEDIAPANTTNYKIRVYGDPLP